MNGINGSIIWLKWIDGAGYDEVYSLVLDSLNNIYITGDSESGTIKIDELTIHRSDKKKAIFLAKFEPKNGEIKSLLWITGNDVLYAYSLACDTFNNIYLSGRTKSNNIIIKANTYSTLNQNKIHTSFIIKFNEEFNVEWLKLIEGDKEGHTYAITTDNSNNVYMTGSTASSQLIIGEAQYKNVSANNNAYIIKIKYDGYVEWFRWLENYEEKKTTFIKDILVDKNYFIYINAYTNGSKIYFNNNDISFINNNLNKPFILKYNLNDILNEYDSAYINNNQTNYNQTNYNQTNYNQTNYMCKHIFYFVLFIIYIYAIWLLYKTIN